MKKYRVCSGKYSALVVANNEAEAIDAALHQWADDEEEKCRASGRDEACLLLGLAIKIISGRQTWYALTKPNMDRIMAERKRAPQEDVA